VDRSMRHAQAWVVKLVLSGQTIVSEQKAQASSPGVKTGPKGSRKAVLWKKR
jgi:hypothetical protein